VELEEELTHVQRQLEAAVAQVRVPPPQRHALGESARFASHTDTHRHTPTHTDTH